MDGAILSLLNDSNEYMRAVYALVVLLISAVIGGAFGVEREKNGHAAGLRTHMIISLAGTLAGFFGRVMEGSTPYVLGGTVLAMAFISMGSIAYNGKDVKGVTTSSTVFITGLIGLAIGLGYIAEGLIATALCLILLITLTFVERKTSKRDPTIIFILNDDKDFASTVVSSSKTYGLKIRNMSSKIVQYHNEDAVRVEVTFYKAPDETITSLAEEVASLVSPLHYDVKTPRML